MMLAACVMTMSVIDEIRNKTELLAAVKTVRSGGVIAYPTESCFGLGCDPKNPQAVRRLLALKRRSYRKGLILIASSVQQIQEYADVQSSPMSSEILDSWPGPNTWLLQPTHKVSRLVRGKFENIAIRLTAHPIATALCDAVNGAIVSTSLNFQGQAPLKTQEVVRQQFGSRIDFIVSGNIGHDNKPSTIRDGLSGNILRK